MSTSDFNEIRASNYLGQKVATSEERERLWNNKVQLERDFNNLFTPENRRRGIQIIYLELIRSYQNAYQKGSLSHTQERRKEFGNLMRHIRQNEIVLQNRFVNPRPATEPMPRRLPFPIVHQSSIRQALLSYAPVRSPHN
ncbi:unnamed protein product [Caenorhabditis brenneri]